MYFTSRKVKCLSRGGDVLTLKTFHMRQLYYGGTTIRTSASCAIFIRIHLTGLTLLLTFLLANVATVSEHLKVM